MSKQAYSFGYIDGYLGLRPFELGSSIAAFDWETYNLGRAAGKRARAEDQPDSDARALEILWSRI